MVTRGVVLVILGESAPNRENWACMRFVGAVCVILALVIVLVACGSSTGGTQTTPSATSPTPSPPPLACTTGGAASGTWPGPSAGTSTTPPIVSAVAAGDTLTLTFQQGTPAFEVKTQSGTHFVKDPSGQSVDLAGTAGVTIVLRGFRGDIRNYTGPVSISSDGPRLLQVYELGDFEGVVTWAAGLSSTGCAAVAAAGSTLTFQFVAPPA
jgi:hypothetical protein